MLLALCSATPILLQPSPKRLCGERFVVPEWEITSQFDPLAASESFRTRKFCWKTLPETSSRAAVPGAVEVSEAITSNISVESGEPCLVRDPDSFVAGELP